MNSFAELFTPFQIGRLHLKNRIAFAPVATLLVDSEGNVTDRLISYYTARAKGGVGLIVVESCAVAPEGMALGEGAPQTGVFRDPGTLPLYQPRRGHIYDRFPFNRPN